jgi:hypothetical protein
MREGAVIFLIGVAALISYSVGRHDAPTEEPSHAVASSNYARPVTLVDAAPDAPIVKPRPTPASPATRSPNISRPAPPPEAKRTIEVALTAAAIAALIVKANRDRYYATGHPCARPDDLMRNGRACGGRSAYSRPGGAAPLCYPTDVTAAMIDDYRKTLAR